MAPIGAQPMTEMRCVWCNGAGKLTTLNLKVADNLLVGKKTRSFFVHDEHAGVLREFLGSLARTKRAFMLSLGSSLTVLPLSAGLVVTLEASERVAMVVIGLGVSLVGMVLAAFPFPMPEAIRLLGIRGARVLVRAVAMLVGAGGIAMAIFA